MGLSRILRLPLPLLLQRRAIVSMSVTVTRNAPLQHNSLLSLYVRLNYCTPAQYAPRSNPPTRTTTLHSVKATRDVGYGEYADHDARARRSTLHAT